MEKLRDIAFQVLSEKSDVLSERDRIELANSIEERWKNVVKEVAKSEITKRAIENIEMRTGTKLFVPNEGLTDPQGLMHGR